MPRSVTPRASSRQPHAARPRRRGHRSVLVLHCDTLKLHADQLHLGSEADLMGTLAVLLTEGKANVRHINGTDNPNLQQQLRELAEAGEKFDVILVVGHSNADCIRVASDHLATWSEFAAYVQLFDPRRMILIACKAGVWPTARDLFTALPQLGHIYACPANASKELAAYLIAVALMAIDGPLPSKLTRVIQGLAGATAGGQVRSWARKDMHDPMGQALDLMSTLVNPSIRDLPSILKRLFGGQG